MMGLVRLIALILCLSTPHFADTLRDRPLSQKAFFDIRRSGPNLQKLCNKAVKMMKEAMEPLLDSEELDPYAPIVLKLINQIRSHMHDGIPEQNIPPLDPLSIPLFPFQIQRPQWNLEGTLSNVIVKDLATFNVTDLQTSVLNMAANISVHIPEVTIEGDYDAKGKVLYIFPFFGKGPFIINPIDVTSQMFAQLGLREGRFYVKYIDFQVDMARLYTRFDGIMGGGPVSDVSNKVINTLGLFLYKQIEPTIHERIRVLLTNEINQALEGVQYVDIPGGGLIPLRYCDF